MTSKAEIAQAGNTQAELIVNNAFVDGLISQLNVKCKNGMSFPPDYNVSNALMGAYLELKEMKDKNNKPLLESCSQVSVANSLMNMATLGLSVQKKQGYFIAYGGQCQFQKSYFGNITIARRYGLKEINAEVIYDGDSFEYEIIDGKKCNQKHSQRMANIDNTKIKGAYAVLTMNNGEKYLEVMNFMQIQQSWKQGYGYKEGSGTHAKFTDQMAKKTVMNRALKQIINTHGDVFVQEADSFTDETNRADVIDADIEYEVTAEPIHEEFVPEAITEKPQAPSPIEQAKAQTQKEPVPSETQNSTLPPFMQQETM